MLLGSRIIDLEHALVKLAKAIDWRFLEEKFGAVYSDKPGHPPLPTRLMAGLAVLKHSYDLSEEGLCERWAENPVFPVFLRRGVLPTPVFVRPLVADALAPAHGRGEACGVIAGEPGDGSADRSAEAFGFRPGGGRHHGAAESGDVPDRCQASQPGARTAGAAGRQSRRQASPILPPGRQTRPDQTSALCPCASATEPAQAQDLSGGVIRDIGRRIAGNEHLQELFARELALARRVLAQQRRQTGSKVYSLHAPEVECIGKGKAHQPYEFGVKVSVATPVKHCAGGQFVAHVAALPGNPYDGHTLDKVIPAIEALVGNILDRVIADAGYRGHNASPEHKFSVYTAGQKRRITPQIKREFKRRAAVEPVIGHLKDHRMGRNYLAHSGGDAANAVLAAAGYNFRRLLQWLRLLLLRILIALELAAQLRSP